MNKKKRALALGLAATQLSALSAVVAPLTAMADAGNVSTVTTGEVTNNKFGENAQYVTVDGDTVSVNVSGLEAAAKESGNNNATFGLNIKLTGAQMPTASVTTDAQANAASGKSFYGIAYDENTSYGTSAPIQTDWGSYTVSTNKLFYGDVLFNTNDTADPLKNWFGADETVDSVDSMQIWLTAADVKKIIQNGTNDQATFQLIMIGTDGKASKVAEKVLTFKDTSPVEIAPTLETSAADDAPLDLTTTELKVTESDFDAAVKDKTGDLYKKILAKVCGIVTVKATVDTDEVTLNAEDYTLEMADTVVAAGTGKTSPTVKVTLKKLNDTVKDQYTLKAGTYTVDVPVKFVAEATLQTLNQTGVSKANEVSSATVSATVTRGEDELTLGTDKVAVGDELKIAISIGTVDTAKWGDAAAEKCKVTVGQNNTAATDNGDGTFSYTVAEGDIEDGGKLTIKVAGKIVEDTTEYTVTLPADGTGYTVSATYKNDSNADTALAADTKLTAGKEITITIAPAAGYVLDTTTAPTFNGKAMTADTGNYTAAYKITAADATDAAIDLSEKLEGVKALREITVTAGLDEGVATATPVDLSTGANALTKAEYDAGTTVTDAIKKLITDAVKLEVKDTASSPVPVTLAAGDFELTPASSATAGTPDTVDVTFTLTTAGAGKYKLASSVSAPVKVAVPVKFAKEYTIHDASSLTGATVTLGKATGKVGDEIKITVAATTGKVIDEAPKLKTKTDTTGTAFTKNATSGAWECTYTIKAEDEGDTASQIDLTVEATILTQETLTASDLTFVVDPATNTAKIQFANAGTYSIDGGADITTTAANEQKGSYDDTKAGTKVKIVKKGDGTTTADSAEVEVTLPSKGTAPSGLSYDATETDAADNGFTITGLDTTMQYKLKTATSWTDFVANAKLPTGEYEVRTKATATLFASDPIDLKVTSETVINVAATAASIPDAEFDPSTTYVDATITLTNTGANADASLKAVLPDTWAVQSGAEADGETIKVAKGGTKAVTVRVPVTGAKAYEGTVKFVDSADAAVERASADVSFEITKKAVTVAIGVSSSTLTSAGGDVTVTYTTLPANVTATLTCAGATVDGTTITLPANTTATAKTYTVNATATSDNYTITFTPATVEVAAMARPAGEYAVQIGAVTHGTVTSDKAYAAEDAEVTLTITPDDGYEVDEITVAGASGNVTVTNNKFTMPGEDVNVTVTFAEATSTPVTPSSPGKPSSGGNRPIGGGGRPSSSGGSGSTSSSPVISDINASKPGDTVSVPSGTSVVTSSTLEAAKDKNVTLNVPVSSTYSWSINPSEMGSTSEAVSLRVTSTTVSSKEVSKVEGAPVTKTMAFTTVAKDLGKSAKLTVTTAARPSATNPQFANLYKVKSDGTLEFVDVVPVNDAGKAVLPITDAGTYSVLISTETKKAGDINNDCKVDLTDLQSALKLFVNASKPITRKDNYKLDYNNTGSVQLTDISSILKDYVNGKLK